MNCQQADNLLPLAVFDEVDAPERAQLDAHLVQCATCRQKFADLKATADLLAQGVETSGQPKLTPNRRNVLASAATAPSSSALRKPHRSFWQGPVRAVYAVAALLLIFALLSSLFLPAMQKARDSAGSAGGFVSMEAARPAPPRSPAPRPDRQSQSSIQLENTEQLGQEMTEPDRTIDSPLRRLALAKGGRSLEDLRSKHATRSIRTSGRQARLRVLYSAEPVAPAVTASPRPDSGQGGSGPATGMGMGGPPASAPPSGQPGTIDTNRGKVSIQAGSDVTTQYNFQGVNIQDQGHIRGEVDLDSDGKPRTSPVDVEEYAAYFGRGSTSLGDASGRRGGMPGGSASPADRSGNAATTTLNGTVVIAEGDGITLGGLYEDKKVAARDEVHFFRGGRPQSEPTVEKRLTVVGGTVDDVDAFEARQGEASGWTGGGGSGAPSDRYKGASTDRLGIAGKRTATWNDNASRGRRFLGRRSETEERSKEESSPADREAYELFSKPKDSPSPAPRTGHGILNAEGEGEHDDTDRSRGKNLEAATELKVYAVDQGSLVYLNRASGVKLRGAAQTDGVKRLNIDSLSERIEGQAAARTDAPEQAGVTLKLGANVRDVTESLHTKSGESGDGGVDKRDGTYLRSSEEDELRRLSEVVTKAGKMLSMADALRDAGESDKARDVAEKAEIVLKEHGRHLTESQYGLLKKAAEQAAHKIRSAEYASTLQPKGLPKAPGHDQDGLALAATFKAGPVNPFVMTDKDRWSTFALDVDTASYSVARNYIRHGYLPPPASVRMEEFINAFDYNYPTRSDRAFEIHSATAPSTFGKGLTMVKVGVKGRVIGRDMRKAAHLVFVIDTSGSMAREDRIPFVQRGLKLLAGQLAPADRVSVVTYGTKASLVLQASGGKDRSSLRATIDSLQCQGSTNLVEGLALGYEVAVQNFVPGQINRVILLSDGVANIGETEGDAILSHVEAFRGHGITFTSVGFGGGSYNDVLLEKLANRGDGTYVFIDSVAEADRVFGREMIATLQTIAYDAKIQVEFNRQRVRRYRLIGYENRAIADKDFRNDTIDAGEVGSGQSSTALYEIELADNFDSARPVDLGTVYVRYRDAHTGQIEEISHRLTDTAVKRHTIANSPRFHLAACAAEFAEILRQSEHAQGAKLDNVEHVLRQVCEQLPLDTRAHELLNLIRSAKGLPAAP